MLAVAPMLVVTPPGRNVLVVGRLDRCDRCDSGGSAGCRRAGAGVVAARQLADGGLALDDISGIGVGVASFAQASQANPLAVGNRPAHAHSLPVEALAELGPAGLTGVLLLGIWLVH